MLVAGLFDEGGEGLAEDPGAQVSISTKVPLVDFHNSTTFALSKGLL